MPDAGRCSCGRSLFSYFPIIQMHQFVVRGPASPFIRRVGTELPPPDLATPITFRCECGRQHTYPLEAPITVA